MRKDFLHRYKKYDGSRYEIPYNVVTPVANNTGRLSIMPR